MLRQFASSSASRIRRPLQSIATIPAISSPRLTPSSQSQSPILRLCLHPRTRTYVASTVPKPTRLPQDEEIPFAEIHFVDETGLSQGVKSLESVLSSIDRNIYHLVCVNSQMSETTAPICKLVSKVDMFAHEQQQYRKKKEKKNNKNPATIVKIVELSWAIAPNDLGHRLKKIGEFLQKGNRVEIVLGTKKGMAKQKLGTMIGLAAEIRKSAEEFGKEWKRAEGGIGTKYIMFFEGRKAGNVANVAKEEFLAKEALAKEEA